MKKKMSKKHEHEYSVSEFYTGTNHVVFVAMLICECGQSIWEELIYQGQEDE